MNYIMRFALSIMMTLFAFSAFAQISKEDMTIIQNNFQKGKSELLKESLQLSEEQDKIFWPLYEVYESKRLDLSSSRLAIINDYLKQFDTLSDKEAIDLINRALENDKDFISLQKSYMKKFADAIGGKNAAKFYQLENYLQEIIRIDVQDEIPFIGELKEHKQ